MNKTEFLLAGNILKKSMNAQSSPERYIKGYCSVPVVDFENEVISTDAYDNAIETVVSKAKKSRPIPIFIEHRRKELSLPIGSVIDAGKDERGLWFKGKIAKGAIGDSVWDLISQNILYSVSMGGEAIKKHRKYDTKINKDITVIDDLIFRELSLTGLPVNEEAVFTIAKSIDIVENKEKFSKNVMGSLKKLNDAIDYEKSIHGLQKAVGDVETGKVGLDDEAIKRIEDSMRTLARVLGIKSDFEKPVEEKPIEEKPVEEKKEEPTLKEEVKPKVEVPSEEKKEEVAFEGNLASPEPKALEETTLGNDKTVSGKLDTIIDLLKKQGGENSVNLLKCAGCNSAYEKSDYDVNFCPKCGYDFNMVHNANANEEYNLDIRTKEQPLGSIREPAEYADGGMERNEVIDEVMEEERIPGEGEEMIPGEGEEMIPEEREEIIPEEEEEEEIIEDAALFCKSCDSVFSETDDYKMEFCPKCGDGLEKGVGSVAVAKQPQGAKTKWGKTPAGKKSTSGDSVAVAASPKGTNTKWTKKARRRADVEKNLEIEQPAKTGTGESVAAFKDGDFQDANKKVRTDKEDSTLHDWDKNFQQFEGKIDEKKLATYETDRKIGKAMDTRLGKIEKALENISNMSVGKRSKVEKSEKEDIEKSGASEQVSQDRFLAQVILGKRKI